MRVLHLCPKVPWPPDDGGRVAMRTLALALRRAGAEVRVLALNPGKHEVDPASFPEEVRLLGLEAVRIDTAVTATGALKSLLLGTSYNVERFRSEAFERRLLELVREAPPEVVLLEGLYLLPYVPALREASPALLVLRAHNVEHEIWEGLVRAERRGPRRLYLGHLAKRLKEYEVAHLDEVDALVPVTREDADAFRRLGSTRPLHVAPVGIESAGYPDRSGHGDAQTLVFLGALDWRPNLEAVRWFLESVWPLVRRAVPAARFHVAGSNPPRRLGGSAGTDGVRFLGRVPDARDFLASGAAMVVPVLSGGGVRVKIIEAMALGVPVVSTRLGATGIAGKDGEELLLADGPDRLAEACVSLLTDRPRALAIGRAGRQAIRRSFDADAVGRALLAFLEERLRCRSAATV